MDGYTEGKRSQAFLGWQEQSCRELLVAALDRGESVDLYFDRPLNNQMLKDLNLYSSRELARLVYVPNGWFLRENALKSVPNEWQNRTYEKVIDLTDLSNMRVGTKQKLKWRQVLNDSVTFLAAIRVCFWSTFYLLKSSRWKQVVSLIKH